MGRYDSDGSRSGPSWRTAPKRRWGRSSSSRTARRCRFSNCASSTSPRLPPRRAEAAPMQAWDQLLQPIPGSNPAGANVRYDAVYDKLKEARREEEDVDQGEWKRPRKVADWPLVIKLTGETLATKSKDLQIAAWLTEALLKQEGLGGLRAGLELLRALLDKFWDQVYPELEGADTEL